MGNRTRFAVIWILVLVCGLGHAKVLVAEECQSLRIVNKRFNEELSRIEADLENVSDHVVTAWRVTVLLGDTQGGQRVFALDQDFVQGLQHERIRRNESFVETAMGPILPGATFPFHWGRSTQDDYRGFGFSVTKLAVTACVFEDRTSDGDSEHVDGIFAARVARLQDLRAGLIFLDSEGQRRPLDSKKLIYRLEEESERLRSLARLEIHSLSPYPQAASVAAVGKLELSELFDEIREALAAERHRENELVMMARSQLKKEYELLLRNVRSRDLDYVGELSRDGEETNLTD